MIKGGGDWWRRGGNQGRGRGEKPWASGVEMLEVFEYTSIPYESNVTCNFAKLRRCKDAGVDFDVYNLLGLNYLE